MRTIISILYLIMITTSGCLRNSGDISRVSQGSNGGGSVSSGPHFPGSEAQLGVGERCDTDADCLTDLSCVLNICAPITLDDDSRSPFVDGFLSKEVDSGVSNLTDASTDCAEGADCPQDEGLPIEDPDSAIASRDAEMPMCTPRASAICHDTDIYWVDSCGVRGELKRDCQELDQQEGSVCMGDPPRCECRPQMGARCVDNDSYWVNSCGEVGDLIRRCNELVCDASLGECVERTSGQGSCSDPFEVRGTYVFTLNSCDSEDTLSFCGSQGVNEVAVRIKAGRPCDVVINTRNASIHAVRGACAESGSCISGFETFNYENVSDDTLFIVEPATCSDVIFDVLCD